MFAVAPIECSVERDEFTGCFLGQQPEQQPEQQLEQQLEKQLEQFEARWLAGGDPRLELFDSEGGVRGSCRVCAPSLGCLSGLQLLCRNKCVALSVISQQVSQLRTVDAGMMMVEV